MSPLMYLWINYSNDLIENSADEHKKEYRALGKLNQLIKINDFEGAYHTLKYLNNYKDVTKNLENKLSNYIKNKLVFDIVLEHAKI